MKKKVLVVNTKYTIFGGEDANIQQELNLLSDQYETNYLEFANTKHLNFYDIISLFTGSNYKSNMRLRKKLSEFNPDVVYVHNTWYKANLGIFKILKKNNIKTVLKIHNFRYDCTRYFLSRNHLRNDSICSRCGYDKNTSPYFNKYFKDSFIKSFFIIVYGKKYFNILKNSTSKIVVLNNFHKDYLIKTGVNKQIDIVFNPLNVNHIKKNVYNPESLNVVYAGQISTQKGVDRLLEVWDEFQSNKLVLNIIGPLVNKEIIKNKKFKNVNFLGEKNNEETLNIISKSRAVITATKMYEGQPRLLSEASILGVPSIYPSFGGMDEYFPVKYNLKFTQYDYQDLLVKLNELHNKDLLIENSKKVKKNYDAKFNNTKNLEKITEVFNS